MAFWHRVVRGLRALVQRSKTERDMADEIEAYLREAEAEHRALGLGAEAARRAARIELGGITPVQEQLRDVGWDDTVRTFLADLRYAARRLRAEPGFTIVAGLTLAVGIGATTAVVSAVYPVLFQPLPYPHAERIAMIWDTGTDESRLETTFGTYRELADRARTLEAIAVMKPWQPTVTGAEEPERFDGQRVSADYFRVLDVAPAIGRAFLSTDDRLGSEPVVILSHALWQRRYAGDPAILGRQIILDGDPVMVVGVMPEGFQSALSPAAQLWAPLRYDMTEGRAWGHHLRMVARLRPGVKTEEAARELHTIAESPVQRFPRATWAALEGGLRLIPLQEDITQGVRPALLAVVAAVALLLTIASVNVTNLLLARGVRRRAEFALRAALGAAQGRLVRQVLIESLLLAAVGGAVAMVVALVGVRGLVALSPAALPRVEAIGLHGGVLAFGCILTAIVGVAFGLAPALHASRTPPHLDLQRGSPRAAAGHRRTTSVLVVVEVGLALVLLVGAGLLLRSLQRLFAVDPGFEPARLLTMQIQTAGHHFDDEGTRLRFFDQALAAVHRLPAVATAALTSQLPLSGDAALYGVHFEPAPAEDLGKDATTLRYVVTPDYFGTMEIPVTRGRPLDDRDRSDAPRVAVISASLARRRLPGLDPIGQQLRIGTGPLRTVVGVVGDVKTLSLAIREPSAVYIPMAQAPWDETVMSVVVRSRTTPTGLAAAVRGAVWSVDKDQPIVRLATMDDLVATSAAERRFALAVFATFAVAALFLAAAGIYGVLSGSVAERTRELGVRAALGASRGRIVALVLRQGMVMTFVGVIVGTAGAAAATRGIGALLFGVSPLDPTTFVGVSAVLVGVALVACAIPAWRAARVDPVRTLRAE